MRILCDARLLLLPALRSGSLPGHRNVPLLVLALLFRLSWDPGWGHDSRLPQDRLVRLACLYCQFLHERASSRARSSTLFAVCESASFARLAGTPRMVALLLAKTGGAQLISTGSRRPVAHGGTPHFPQAQKRR